jgi:hypothetical protein
MISGIEDLVAYLRVFHRRWLDSPGLDAASIPRDLPDGWPCFTGSWARLWR